MGVAYVALHKSIADDHQVVLLLEKTHLQAPRCGGK